VRSRAICAREHEQHTAGIDIAMKLSDPEKLVTLTRNNIINLRTVIGNESTQKLLDKWDAYTKNGTLLSEGKLDNDQFNAFATRAGLDPNSKDDTMKKRIVDTRDKVERIIGSEQQAKKRPLTRDEKDKILQQQIDNTVIQHNAILLDKPCPRSRCPTTSRRARTSWWAAKRCGSPRSRWTTAPRSHGARERSRPAHHREGRSPRCG
jgi:hypothetical protein